MAKRTAKTSKTVRGKKHDRAENKLRDYYALGNKADENVPAKTPGKIDAFAERESIDRDKVVKARNFATKYEAKDLDKLCTFRTPKGNPLTVGHIDAILAIPKANALALLQQAAESWSVRDLKRQVRNDHEKKSSGGRPVKLPSSKPEALRWLRNAREQ